MKSSDLTVQLLDVGIAPFDVLLHVVNDVIQTLNLAMQFEDLGILIRHLALQDRHLIVQLFSNFLNLCFGRFLFLLAAFGDHLLGLDVPLDVDDLLLLLRLFF